MSRVAASSASRRDERLEATAPRTSRSSGSRAPRTGCRGRRPHPRARSRKPADAASGDGRRDGRLDVGRERRRVEHVRGPERVHPDRLEPGRGDRLRRGRSQVRARPSRTCRRRRRRPAGPARGAPHSVTAARRRTRWRRPSASAICASRRSSPTDSTVTARTPAATAAASSSSRLPGPVTTTRSGSKPARRTWRSSPPEATSAPSPRPIEVAHDREARVGLDRVGEVDGGGRARRRASTWRLTTSRS